jgi:sulfatase modifying factor 1
MSKRSQILLTFYTFITLLLGWQLSINAQTISYAPTITNINIIQGTTGAILIKFDIDDPDGGLLEVKMLASKDNGQTYTVTPKSIMGDAFKYIIPGKGNIITWDVSKDLPGVDPNNIKIRLIADDGIRLLPDAEISSSTEIQSESTSTKTEVSLGANEKMGNDGAIMMLIPAGDFEMGSISGDADERPVHTVTLDAFYIDLYEVTNDQYRKFVEATGHEKPVYWKYSNFNEPNQPVVGVSWDDANAYAKWAGKRLPTEAEWEKAARGGLIGKKYAWGDSSIPPPGAGNFADETAKLVFKKWDIINGYDDGYSHPAPVGSFSPNGYGVYDMMGNVWEWCSDYYGSGYYASSAKSNPKGPASGRDRVIRGGSWFADKDYLRVPNRFNYEPSYVIDSAGNIGFRCVQDADK